MKHNKLIFKLSLIICFSSLSSMVISKEINSNYNFFSGIFDFNSSNQKSTLVGFQHQNKDKFQGNFSPISGAMITTDSAAYLYSGIQANYNLGKINIIPSFAPGLYSQGKGKDLGYPVEFKSELQISLDIFSNSKLGFSYNHLSNASLGDRNPGVDSYMFNFFQTF